MSVLHTFVDAYRTAFSRCDEDALAALFVFPVHIVSAGDDGAEIQVFEHGEWRSVLSGLLDAYRSLGVAEADPVALDATEVTSHVASARVRWQLRREDGTAIFAFTAVYTLVQLDGRWRVAAIAHDEVPKLQAALGR